jgi:biopolymer transport protein ExbB
MTHPGDFSLLADGGPFVWLMLGLGGLGLLFAVERFLFLHRGHVRSSDFIEGVRNNLRAGRPLEALAACEESPGAVPRVVKAALLRMPAGEEAMRAAATEAALLELPVLERRLGSLASLATLVPVIALAGAALAALDLVTALRAGSLYASADALLLRLQAALALTALGLTLSALLAGAHHFLSGRVRAIAIEMETAAWSLITFVRHELPEEQAAERKRQA